MRRLRYQVAMSLDGFIADTHDGYDWITSDPTIDFAALFREFDLFVMGRRTWDVVRPNLDAGMIRGKRTVVFSRTLAATTEGNVTITAEDPVRAVTRFKGERGKDIWLFGGGVLFRTLLDAGLVDAVEIALMPTLLGAGVPVLAPGGPLAGLQLVTSKVLPSGIVMLGYGPVRGASRASG